MSYTFNLMFKGDVEMGKANMIRLFSKICIFVFLILQMVLYIAPVFADTPAEEESNAGFRGIIKRENTYDEYISKHKDAKRPSHEIDIAVENYMDTDMDVKIFNNFEGSEGKCIWTDEQGYITWEVDVPEAGLYSIFIEYFPVEGRSTDINGRFGLMGSPHSLMQSI